MELVAVVAVSLLIGALILLVAVAVFKQEKQMNEQNNEREETDGKNTASRLIKL